jgi:hypothetical protein
MNDLIVSLIRSCYMHVVHGPDITDNIFLYIEGNPHLKSEYMHMCQSHGVRTVNQTMGRKIKQLYHLPNTGKSNAKSTLIGSFTRH